MKRLIGSMILVSLAMVFAIQNADPVPVHFLLWKAEGTSLALVLLFTFVAGLSTGLIFLIPSLKGKRKDKTNANITSKPENQDRI